MSRDLLLLLSPLRQALERIERKALLLLVNPSLLTINYLDIDWKGSLEAQASKSS